MKIHGGTIAIRNDQVVVLALDGKNYPVNSNSLGNKSYDVGEHVTGVVINGKISICRVMDHELIGEIYGYISRDVISEEEITITLVHKEGADYTIGNEMVVDRHLITNY